MKIQEVSDTSSDKDVELHENMKNQEVLDAFSEKNIELHGIMKNQEVSVTSSDKNIELHENMKNHELSDNSSDKLIGLQEYMKIREVLDTFSDKDVEIDENIKIQDLSETVSGKHIKLHENMKNQIVSDTSSDKHIGLQENKKIQDVSEIVSDKNIELHEKMKTLEVSDTFSDKHIELSDTFSEEHIEIHENMKNHELSDTFSDKHIELHEKMNTEEVSDTSSDKHIGIHENKMIQEVSDTSSEEQIKIYGNMNIMEVSDSSNDKHIEIRENMEIIEVSDANSDNMKIHDVSDVSKDDDGNMKNPTIILENVIFQQECDSNVQMQMNKEENALKSDTNEVKCVNFKNDFDVQEASKNSIEKHFKIPEIKKSSDTNEEEHRKIHEILEIQEVTTKTSEIEMKINQNKAFPLLARKSNVAAKKGLIGILKVPHEGKNLKSFPSLPETFLKDLGVRESMSISTENLSEKDIENKFCSLSLAFKTDLATVSERKELLLRQRDIAEENFMEEIKQLKYSVQSLTRIWQDSESRATLEGVLKQINILKQSTNRMASCAQQLGAVQQESRVSTCVEIMMLHLDNIKRSYERERNELEDARGLLGKNRILDGKIPDEGTRGRSVSVVHGRSHTENPGARRTSADTINKFNIGVSKNGKAAVNVAAVNGTAVNGTAINSTAAGRPRSILKMVSARSIAHSFSEDLSRKIGKKKSTFTTITEDNSSKTDNINNNNCPDNNNNKETMLERRNESLNHQLDVDTIIEEEMEHYRRSPGDNIEEEKRRNIFSRNSMTGNSLIHRSFATSSDKICHRKRSVLLHLHEWYSRLRWPYDEEEMILGVRYLISGVLSVAAFAVLLGTFLSY